MSGEVLLLLLLRHCCCWWGKGALLSLSLSLWKHSSSCTLCRNPLPLSACWMRTLAHSSTWMRASACKLSPISYRHVLLLHSFQWQWRPLSDDQHRLIRFWHQRLTAPRAGTDCLDSIASRPNVTNNRHTLMCTAECSHWNETTVSKGQEKSLSHSFLSDLHSDAEVQYLSTKHKTRELTMCIRRCYIWEWTKEHTLWVRRVSGC